MKRLSVLSLLDKGAYGGAMFMTEADVHETSGRLNVNISENARIATNRTERWELADASNPLWRWSAGGGLEILRLRDATVALLQRSDPSIPVWPDHLTAATGVASSPREWIAPGDLLREVVEENVIAVPGGLVVPVFDDMTLDRLVLGAMPLVRHMIGVEYELPDIFRTNNFHCAPARLLPLNGEQEIVVSVCSRECSVTRGLAVMDPQTRGIDILRAIEVELPYRLDEIALFEAEQKVDGRAVNGHLLCLALDKSYRPQEIIGAFKAGRPADRTADLTKMTPVLRQVLSALAK